MPSIVLSHVNDASSDPWLVAVTNDYAVPSPCRTFVGRGLYNERVAFFIGEDGGGYGYMDSKPDDYVAASKAAVEGNFDLMSAHGGVDEYEFEPGTYRYEAKRIPVEAGVTFGGI